MKLSLPQSTRFFCAILFVVPFLFFWKNFLPDQLVLTSDFNIASMALQHENFVKQGWNACWSGTWWMGLSGAVPTLHAENILIWLVPPILYAKFSMPFYLAIGGLSAYAFGRAVGFRPVVALVFGLGWELVGSGITDVPGGHHFRLFMLGVLPLMYLGLWRAYKSGKLCGVLLAAIVVALMMGGLPDSGAILALGGVFFFVWLNAQSLQTGRFWMQAALGTLVTLLLCGQLVFSYIPYWTSGQRAADLALKSTETAQEKWEWHTQWSFAPEEILELVAPGFFGWQSMAPENPYWGRVGASAGWEETQQGFRNFRIDNPTTGSAVAALAIVGLLACWRRRSENHATDMARMARCFSILALVTFLMSLGRHFAFYRWLYDCLPFMQGWRNPNKFFFTTSFCIVYLAGYGAQILVDALAKQSDDPAGARLVRSSAWLFWKIAAALLAGALFVLLQQNDLILEFTGHSWSEEEARQIVSNMGVSLLRAALFWGCWGGLIYMASRWSKPHPERVPWLVCAWIVISVAEMGFIASHYLSYFNYRRALQPSALLRRVIDDGKHDLFRFKMMVSDSTLNNLYFLQIPYHHIQSIDIPAASRIPDDYRRYFGELEHSPVLMWELANVRYVLAQTPVANQIDKLYGKGRLEWVTDYAVEGSGDSFGGYRVNEVPQNDPNSSYQLLKLSHPLPRALVVPEIRYAHDVAELFKAMKDEKTDFHKTMLALPLAGTVPTQPGAPAKDFGAEVKSYTDNRIVIEAHADHPAYLLLNDKYDPVWKATVNGQPAPIFRANFLMRGVEIPAGRSEVVFSYQMERKLLLFTASAWAAVLLFGCLFCVFPGKRSVP